MGVTIMDDDVPPVLSFSAAGYSVLENNGNVVIDVALSVPSTLLITVDYSTSHITADNNDYVSTSGTLTFAAGEITKTIAVAINNDEIDENNESNPS